ncbi:MAG: hypothetical protein ACI8W7_004309, partial [Gammaproteobacteria bacterium]
GAGDVATSVGAILIEVLKLATAAATIKAWSLP